VVSVALAKDFVCPGLISWRHRSGFLYISQILLTFYMMPVVMAQQDASGLADLSLEELSNIQITSVSRRRESLSEAPASIFVISAEDIRRSGATTIPEILGLAPNLQVARIDTVQYAITARGFNNAIGNKLLVLIDGRTVYTPMFSGVFWEMQDIMPEDIDRVEVISGPGATLWGANAVNGVINIITRRAFETQGALLTGDAGDDERGAALRWGGAAGSNIAFRAYGKYRDWDNSLRSDGTEAPDQWQRGQIGFRTDWDDTDQRATLQGDLFRGESQHRGFVGTLEVPRIKVSSVNLLVRWNRDLGNDSGIRIQAYWNHLERDELAIFRPKADIFDIDMLHNFSIGTHRIQWGGGYRHSSDEVEPGFFTVFVPDSRKLDWANVFIQDEIQLGVNLEATVGLKLERNDFTGVEYLPSARLAWIPADNRLLWTAVSRAVRAPSRFDRDVFFPGTPPFIIAGGPDFESEVANVFELGYRDQPLEVLNYSITLFYHDWDNLRSGTPLPLPVFLVNNIEGESYGVEGWTSWQVLPAWRLSAGVTVLDKKLEFKPGTSDTSGVNNSSLHNDPDYQWQLRSIMDLTPNLHLDFHLRGVDELVNEPVPGYTELDARIGWKLSYNFEISVTGRNLLHKSHPEFGSLLGRSEIGRSMLLGFKWSL